MAYNVTKRFREIVYSGGAIYKCSLKINNKLVPNRQIAKITISNPIIDTTSDYFYVGSYIAQKLTIKFKNLENLDIKSNNDVSLNISLDVDGTEVNVPIGKFLIDDLSENYYETCEITCLDYSVKAKNNIDYSPCFVDGKATIDTIFEYICNHFGITFDPNYPKTNGNIEVGVYDNTVSGKRYISYIAELKGCNAKHGRDGILYLKPLKQTSNVSINALKSKSWKLGEKFKISGVSYDDGARPFKTGDTTNNTLFIRSDNPFVQDQTTIDNIYNVVKDTVIWNLKTENYGDISLDPWDNISYQLGKETYNTLMNVNLTYEMNISSTNEVKLPTKQQEQTTNVVGGDIQSKLLRVGRTIDLINGTIEDLSEKIVDISAQASGKKEVELENCSETPLYKLKITGDDSLLFPGDKKKYFTYENYEGSTIDTDIKGSSYDINNLDVKGRSTQEVRSGKNLFIPLGSKTVSGITVTENNDGTYNISGTATSNIEYTGFISLDNSKIINGETYILSSNKDLPAGLTARIEMYNDATWLRVFVPSIGAINKTQTGVANTANATRVRFGMFISSGTTLDIKNIGFQLEKGSTATSFEQYGKSPSPDYPSEIKSVKGRNICDVSTSQIGVSWILSSDSARAICNVRVMPNTTYSLSFEDISGIDGMFFGQKVKATDTNVINGMAQITTNRQITTTSTTNWLCIQFNKANISLNDIKAIKLQIEKGSIITNYVPYDTIQIMNTGKNIEQGMEQGGISNSGENYSSTTAIRSKYFDMVKPNTTYALSMNSSANGFNVAQYDENKNFISFTYHYGKITTEDNTRYIRISKTATLNDEIQIEEGETVTSYEPNQSQTLNIDLQGNELCSIGDTEDVLGISVTGDTKINKKIGKDVLDGSGTSYVVADSSWGNHVFAYTGNNNRKPWSKGLSDYFTFVQGTGSAFVLNDGEFCIGQGAIIFRNDAINTLEEFKTLLSTHNLTFIYELATPETINLSPTKPLYLYDGINHLTNDNIAYMVAKMVKSTMFLKTSDLYVNQGQSNEKIFNLKIPALRELNGVKDEYNLENTKATLTKRIGLNANLEEYILDEPQIIDLGKMTIELNEGTNILTMPSFPNNYYEVTYLLKNEYTDTFANQAQVSSMINIASDEILIKSKTEILENGDELIASINTKATGNVLIDASRLAQINADKINFSSYDFNVTTQNMKISIGQGDDKKDIINANGVLTNLQFKSSNQIWGNGQSASYPLGFSPEAEIQGGSEIYPSRKSYLQIDYDVPENFVISNAYITIFHTPIYWDNGQYHTWGYCRNLGIFKVTNSGNFVINLAFFGEGETLGEFNTEIINNAFGNNTYWTAKIPNNDSYLSENITTNDLTNNIDKTGHGTLLIQSNDTAPTSNTLAGLYTTDGAGGKTGSAYAILNIIGYTKV